MNKLGYVSIVQAEEQVKTARTEALAFNPLELVNFFVRDCRKFNFKVDSTVPDIGVAEIKAKKLAHHIVDFAQINLDENQTKVFTNRLIASVKVVDDKSLLTSKMTENNICEFCEPAPHKKSFKVADTGKCAKCGKLAECWDHDLIDMYYALGLNDDLIWSHLPRLRDSVIGEGQAVTLKEIGLKIKPLLM